MSYNAQNMNYINPMKMDIEHQVEALEHDLSWDIENPDNTASAAKEKGMCTKDIRFEYGLWKSKAGMYVYNIDNGPGIEDLEQALAFGTKDQYRTMYNRYGTGIFHNPKATADGISLMATCVGPHPWEVHFVVINMKSLDKFPTVQLCWSETSWALKTKYEKILPTEPSMERQKRTARFLVDNKLEMFSDRNDLIAFANTNFIDGDGNPRKGTAHIYNKLDTALAVEDTDIVYRDADKKVVSSWREGLENRWFDPAEGIGNIYMFGEKVNCQHALLTLKNDCITVTDTQDDDIMIPVVGGKPVKAKVYVTAGLCTEQANKPASVESYLKIYANGRIMQYSKQPHVDVSHGIKFFPPKGTKHQAKAPVCAIVNIVFSEGIIPIKTNKRSLKKQAQEKLNAHVSRVLEKMYSNQRRNEQGQKLVSWQKYRENLVAGKTVTLDMLDADVAKVVTDRKRKQPKRKGFSATTKKTVLQKNDNRCSLFKVRLGFEFGENYDHLDGDHSNNSENNCNLLCVNAHDIKTRHPKKYDELVRSPRARIEWMNTMIRHLKEGIESTRELIDREEALKRRTLVTP